MMNETPSRSPRARWWLTLALLAAVAAGCDDRITAPGRDFLIRLPRRNIPVFTPPTFNASPSSTDSIRFEWEDAGAQRYEVVFWRGASEDAIEHLAVDVSVTPDLTLDVPAPRLEEVSYNPTNANDLRTIEVVVFEAPLADIADRLEATGAPPGEPLYYVWSVMAVDGGKRWRSPSLHPMVLRLMP